MTRGRPFEAGNKLGRGRPKGSKNRRDSAGRRLLEEHELPLRRKNIAEALKDNTKSRHYCLDELNHRPRAVSKLKLPPIKTLGDIEKAYNVILNAVASQKCTPADGQALFGMLGETRKVIETQELASRLADLEQLVKKDKV